jgi:hypothetical protein
VLVLQQFLQPAADVVDPCEHGAKQAVVVHANPLAEVSRESCSGRSACDCDARTACGLRRRVLNRNSARRRVPYAMRSICAGFAALRGSVGRFASNAAHSARNSETGLLA